MRHVLGVTVGPVTFRIGSDWRAPVAALAGLYRDHPPAGGVPDYSVRLFAGRPWRRWLRPAVHVGGDHMLPDAQPLALRHGLLAAEMGMNLQLALGARRWLLLHAAGVAQGGRALVMTGESGAGKSTLAALLAARGWRLLGDEFALVGTETGAIHPFPRAVALKNEGIAAVAAHVPADRFGPVLTGTPKGTIRHLRPDRAAIAGMTVPADPALILFPRYGGAAAVRALGQAETFVRLTQASTNYGALGRTGHDALIRLVTRVPAVAIDYPDTGTALAMVDDLWAGLP